MKIVALGHVVERRLSERAALLPEGVERRIEKADGAAVLLIQEGGVRRPEGSSRAGSARWAAIQTWNPS